MSTGSSATLPCFRPVATGLEVDVLVQPRASRSQIVALHDGRLKVQLAAPPVDGAANDALLDLFSKRIGVPRRDLTLVRGETSRRKTVLVRGIAADDVMSALSPESR